MRQIDQLILASYMSRQAKQAGAWGTAKNVANIGSYFLPGVGTARMGYDAFKDFGKGNYLGGAANLVGAGLSLIPGAGGMAGKGVSWLGRLGAKGLSRAGAPTLGRMFGSAVGGTGKGLTAVGQGIDKAVGSLGSGVSNSLSRNLPTFGGQQAARGLQTAGRFAVKQPLATGLVGAGAMTGLDNLQAGQMATRAAQQAQQVNLQDMLMSMRRAPVTQNPMYAGGGTNPNYAQGFWN